MYSVREIVNYRGEVKSAFGGTIIADVEIAVTSIKTPNDELNRLLELDTKPFYNYTPYRRTVSFNDTGYDFELGHNIYSISEDRDTDVGIEFPYTVNPTIAMGYFYHGFFAKGIRFHVGIFRVRLLHSANRGNGIIIVYRGCELLMSYNDKYFQYSVSAEEYVDKVKFAMNQVGDNFSKSSFKSAFCGTL
jgi:hypothetical protein